MQRCMVFALTVLVLMALSVPSLLASETAAGQDASPNTQSQPIPPTPSDKRVAADVKLNYLEKSGFTRRIHHPGATYIKVRFAQLNLLPGHYITVSSPDGSESYTYWSNPVQVKDARNGMYTTDLDRNDVFWAMSITGDTAVIRLHTERNQAALQLDRAQLASFGIAIDTYRRGLSEEEIASEVSIMSICGGDERKNTVCYQTSRPTEYARSQAVAKLIMGGGGSCTAWRVSSGNFMITNNHCMSTQSAVSSSESWFNYCTTTCTGSTLKPVTKVTGNRFFVTNSSLDMTLYSVNNFSTIESFGYLELDVRRPTQGEEIYIPGHGDGRPQRLSIESDVNTGNICRVDAPVTNGMGTNTDMGYKCDTSGGNSGSPVLARSTHKVLALHHLGGCPSGMNKGARSELIWPVIKDYIGGGTTPTPVTRTPTPITVTPTRTPTPITRTPTPVTVTPGTVFSDDFETSKGWVTNADGSDTATLGQWERGDPEATDYNGPKQLGTTTSGSNDLVTGRLAGSAVGAYDLDGGVTSIRSPSITLPSSGNLTLTFRYYLAHASNASSADYLRVSVVSDIPTGSRTVVFEKLGAASDVDASWQTATVSLSGYAGQTIHIQIEAADASTASLLEAAVDDVAITN